MVNKGNVIITQFVCDNQRVKYRAVVADIQKAGIPGDLLETCDHRANSGIEVDDRESFRSSNPA